MKEELEKEIPQKDKDARIELQATEKASRSHIADCESEPPITDRVILASKRRQLERVNLALKRIADGTYGLCADCGDKIPARRLDVEPTATHCVGCLEDIEEKGALGEAIRRNRENQSRTNAH
jgi:RNA polymerase-binding transcription factor DksA